MLNSAIDSRIFRNLFGTGEIRDIFSDEAYIKCLIEVEIALARAEAKVNIIPQGSADVIAEKAKYGNLNLHRMAADTENVGYPVLPLVWQLAEMVPQEHAKYIHWGATTQDIMDCASMLQIRRGLVVIRRNLLELNDILKSLSERYANTPMAGRTHLQHALPITFGYKCAVSLSGIQRHIQRVNEIESRCLLVQFGGAAGSLASLGSDGAGLKVREQLAMELGLHNPSITWHVTRDHIAEIVNFLALIGGSLGKIALDIIIMSSNEVAEVSEPFVPFRGASSTMPQKRNPISSEVILASSKLLRSNASLALDAMVSDFERASGPWHLEWSCVPDSFVLCCGALHQANFIMSGLLVHTDVMSSNLNMTKGLIVAEAVMMGIASELGRQKAHDVVYEACRRAIEEDLPLIDVLCQDEILVAQVREERLRSLCDPCQYLGCCGQMIESVIQNK
ncbi:L-Aspartase-like protein [Aspergillus ambiguus]|uniref:class-II fumarase/aspartase family protein n=1 Tax=Aspergillus ambiguus TaxID=176160 RepID=UPI003CCD5605